MELILQQIGDRVHYDGRNHWIRFLDRFHRYNSKERLPEEDYIPANKVKITKKVELQSLPTIEEKPISSDIINQPISACDLAGGG